MDKRRPQSVAATTVARTSDRETVVTRTFNAPARKVFAAWTRPELFRQWWVPVSSGMAMVACDMDVRIGGSYRLEFSHPDFAQMMVVFGKYLDVTENSRLVWTNDESDAGAVTTVTFTERGDQTIVVIHDLYPSTKALDNEVASGATAGMSESLDQLAVFVV